MSAHRVAFTLIAAGFAAINVAVANPAFSAAPATLTVLAGNASAGAGVTISVTNASVFSFRDLRSGASITCPRGSVVLTGQTKVGTLYNGVPSAASPLRLTQVMFANYCQFASLRHALTAKAFPWGVSAVANSQSASTPSQIQGLSIDINVAGCAFTLGDGSGGAGIIAGSGGAFGMKYVNGRTPTIQVQTTSNPAAATLGISSGGPCASGIYAPGDKWQIYGNTSADRAIFTVNATSPSGANPIAVTAP